MARYQNKAWRLRLKMGLASAIHSLATKLMATEGEAAYTTDTKVLYIKDDNDFNQAGMRYTESASDPSTTELVTAGEFGIHKNTSSGNVFFAFNDGGSIVKVQLT